MQWLWEKRLYSSEKNGPITVQRRFGKWKVIVKGCSQTSQDYGPLMWADACKRLKKNPGPAVHDILLLGFAAGSAINVLHNAFPGCSVTAVEYDPTMIKIAKELQLYKPNPCPTIIEGDAREVITQVGKFDLIIVDLFDGFEPSPLIADPHFLHDIQEHLSEKGVLLANILWRKEYVEAPATSFTHSSIWKFRSNRLAAFWNTNKTE